MNALTTKAIRDVTRRKLRTTLTVLGIAIGVMGICATSMASGQFSSGLQSLNDTTGQPDIQFFTAPTTAPLARLHQRRNGPARRMASRRAATSRSFPILSSGPSASR